MNSEYQSPPPPHTHPDLLVFTDWLHALGSLTDITVFEVGYCCAYVAELIGTYMKK